MMREINLEGIRSLLTLGTDCDHIASVLDEVVFEYIGGILDNSGGVVPGRDACWLGLRQTRNRQR